MEAIFTLCDEHEPLDRMQIFSLPVPGTLFSFGFENSMFYGLLQAREAQIPKLTGFMFTTGPANELFYCLESLIARFLA